MDPSDTSMDPRFSDPTADLVGWEETQRLLETAELFWLSTVRTDGRPHVTPLVAVWLDGAIHFSTGAGEQKEINVRANPHVALITGCDTWDKGADIVVEGEAVRVTDHSQLERLASVWATKWDGRWQYEVRDDGLYHDGGGQALVFSVAPTKILVFAKGTFSQTRHTFV
jgi:general stress protein 26